MSPRARVIAVVAGAALLAAGGTVAFAVVTKSDKGGGAKRAQPLAGVPPLVFDLGVRNDPEGQALRRAEHLYGQKKRAAAGKIFARYHSPEAQIGAAFAAWPDASLGRLERLALDRQGNSLVLLHLGYALYWSGHASEAGTAWRRAAQAQPDSPSAQRADDILNPRFPAGQPFFVPSFAPPAQLNGLSPPQQLVALARAARRPDVHAKLLYGLALQGLGHRLSALRQYEAAARLAPGDAEPHVAAAVARFRKSSPADAFSRLGPLTRRFPRAATVRFHLGLLLFWLARAQPGAIKEGKRQLRLARALEPHSPLAREAAKLLAATKGLGKG
jgi:tetratricopeptide (TPR) repeat protein